MSPCFLSPATPFVLLPRSAGVALPFVAGPSENTSKSFIRHKKTEISLGYIRSLISICNLPSLTNGSGHKGCILESLINLNQVLES